MSGWFPRLSPSGQHVASGNGTLVIDGVERGPGYGPKWISETHLLIADGSNLVGYALNDGTRVVVSTTGFVYFDVAPDGRWIGEHNATLYWSDGGVWAGFATPAISATRWAALTHDTGSLYEGTGQGQNGSLLDLGCLEPRLLATLLCYRKSLRIFGQRDHGLPIVELTIPGEEHFWPVPVNINGEAWVLTNTNTGRLLLYPWGSTVGYVVATGITDFADAKWTGNDVRVVWSNAGILHDTRVDIRGPRVDLRPNIPAPVPVPTPVPTPTPTPHPMAVTPQQILDSAKRWPWDFDVQYLETFREGVWKRDQGSDVPSRGALAYYHKGVNAAFVQRCIELGHGLVSPDDWSPVFIRGTADALANYKREQAPGPEDPQ